MFSGLRSEPRVVGSSRRSFPVWWRVADPGEQNVNWLRVKAAISFVLINCGHCSETSLLSSQHFLSGTVSQSTVVFAKCELEFANYSSVQFSSCAVNKPLSFGAHLYGRDCMTPQLRWLMMLIYAIGQATSPSASRLGTIPGCNVSVTQLSHRLAPRGTFQAWHLSIANHTVSPTAS